MKSLILFFPILLAGCSKQVLPSGSYELIFVSSVWKKSETAKWREGEDSVRQQMLGSLINENLAGKSREQVINLLGSPSTKMDPDGEGPSLSYPTGPQRESYFGVDYEWLIIQFDSKNNYKSYYLASD